MKGIQILLIITIILICYSCNSYKEVIRGSYTVNAPSIAEGEDAIIFGTVKSKGDNKPIPNAAISIADSNIGAITSRQGMFSLPITPGRYHLIFNAVGYDDLHIQKAVIEKGRSLEITVWLGTTKVYQKSSRR